MEKERQFVEECKILMKENKSYEKRFKRHIILLYLK